jgi:hypothetical protein
MQMTDTKSHATDEDWRLSKESPDEVRAKTAQWSFSIATLKNRVSGPGQSQAVLQAHLYLDHVISRMLEENIPAPSHLPLDRTGFSQKLQLAAALALIPDYLTAPVKVVNGIRNKIAHQLEYEVSELDEAKLRSTLEKGADLDDDGTQMSFLKLLQFIVVLTDIARQERAFERLMRVRASANVRVALDKIGPI